MEHNIVYHMMIVDNKQCLGRGAKAVAKPVHCGMGRQTELCSEEAVESGSHIVVGDNMSEGGWLPNKWRP